MPCGGVYQGSWHNNVHFKNGQTFPEAGQNMTDNNQAGAMCVIRVVDVCQRALQQRISTFLVQALELKCVFCKKKHIPHLNPVTIKLLQEMRPFPSDLQSFSVKRIKFQLMFTRVLLGHGHSWHKGIYQGRYTEQKLRVHNHYSAKLFVHYVKGMISIDIVSLEKHGSPHSKGVGRESEEDGRRRRVRRRV